MSKVLILTNYDVGLYNFRRELLERLINEGHDVYISLPYGPRVDDLTKLGCNFIETSIDRRGANPFKDLRLLLFYRKTIKDINPDIILSYTIKPNVYGGIVCRFMKIPYVCNITGLGTAMEQKGIMQKFTLFLYKISLKKAQRVFFQNKENMDFFILNGITIDKFTLLPGSGVNLSFFEALQYPVNNTVSFVFVGRIMKAKGVDEYFAAAQAIRKMYPDTRFHICGFCEQDYDSEMKNLQENSDIIYHGSIDNIRDFLRDMHCTIQPSHHEGMSNTLLESAASARPVIATDIPGCREAVDDGLNGYLYIKGDSSKLIERIEQFLALSWEQKSEMGRLQVNNNQNKLPCGSRAYNRVSS
jgi:galacturonosyltransferase